VDRKSISMETVVVVGNGLRHSTGPSMVLLHLLTMDEEALLLEHPDHRRSRSDL
jgi:hypothetical protein